MVMDYYLTDDEREKYIRTIANDQYKVHSVREKCREYSDYMLNSNTQFRKDLISVDSGEDAIRIHGELSGITKILKAFGIGLDQSVMNEPTEIDLKNWANLSLFRVAIIRRKLNTIKIFLDKSTNAVGIIKVEVLLYSLHRFLTTGDWDDDEIQMLEEDEFHDVSFLMDQSSIDDNPDLKISAPPPKPVEDDKSKDKKKKKKKNKNEKKEEEENNTNDDKENGVNDQEEDGKINKEESNEVDQTTIEKDDKQTNEEKETLGNEDKNNNEVEAEKKEENDSNEKSEVVKNENENLETDEEKEAKKSKEIKAKKKDNSPISRYFLSTRSPNKLRRSSLVQRFTKKKSSLLDEKETFLNDYLNILDSAGLLRKVNWKKHWVVLNNESLDIFKDEKSSTVLKSYPLSDLLKIGESEVESKKDVGKTSLRKSGNQPDAPKGKDYFFILEFGGLTKSILYFQVKDRPDMVKWMITIDALVASFSTSILTEIQQQKYFSDNYNNKNNENNVELGVIKHGNLEWKFDGKKVENQSLNLTFTWNGKELHQTKGEEIGDVQWNGVFLKFAKAENVKFIWIDSAKEFRSTIDNITVTWKYTGNSLYRKDNNDMWIIENRPPLGVIFAICVISSHLSKEPFWLENKANEESSSPSMKRKKKTEKLTENFDISPKKKDKEKKEGKEKQKKEGKEAQKKEEENEENKEEPQRSPRKGDLSPRKKIEHLQPSPRGGKGDLSPRKNNGDLSPRKVDDNNVTDSKKKNEKKKKEKKNDKKKEEEEEKVGEEKEKIDEEKEEEKNSEGEEKEGEQENTENSESNGKEDKSD